MRLALIPIIVLLALLPIAVAHYVLAQGPIQSVEIRVGGDGVATVTLIASVDAGVTTIELPVDPIAVTIDVNSSVSGVEWVLEDGYLYIASPSQGTVRVTYIANASIENGSIMLNVKTNSSVRLILAPTIVLLTLPENIVSIKTLPGGELEIVFTGPATISYTITQPTTTITTPATTTSPTPTTASPTSTTTTPPPTTPTSTPSPTTTITSTTYAQTTSPTATTPTITTTPSTTMTTSTTTSTPIAQTSSPSPTTTQMQPISLSTIIAVAVIVIVIAIIIALIIRRR